MYGFVSGAVGIVDGRSGALDGVGIVDRSGAVGIVGFVDSGSGALDEVGIVDGSGAVGIVVGSEAMVGRGVVVDFFGRCLFFFF